MALRGYKAAATARDTQVRCLVVACGPCVLAVPADWVRSILTQGEVGYGETVSSGGVTYAVTDLTAHLRLPSLTPSTETRIILYGNEKRVCAFAVDRVLELVEPERHDLRPLPTQFRHAERQSPRRLLSLSRDHGVDRQSRLASGSRVSARCIARVRRIGRTLASI